MKKIGFKILLGFLCLIGGQIEDTFASHAAGMEMFYRWKSTATSDSTYEFTVIFYRNCYGISAPTSVGLRSRSASLSSDNTTNISRLPIYGNGVPALSPPNMLNCTDASSLCYEEYVYRGDWTSKGRADDWIHSVEICCRPTGASGAANVNPGYQYVECGLNNLDFPDYKAKNWSPLWHNRRPNHPGHTTDTVINYLFRTLCAGNFYTLDLSVKEYQGDSVSYEFYTPQGQNGIDLTWTNINAIYYSLTHPFPTHNNVPLTINPVTGIISVTPGTPLGTGIYALGIKVTEWRYDTIYSGGSKVKIAKKIGFNKRDMTIWIDDSTTCRKDSVHPKNIVVDLSAKNNIDQLDVYFSTGNYNDPNSLVRCASLSPDGSEFRILDSSNYVYPYDSTVRSIGIHKATWNCQAGLTEKVTLYLAEPLKCNEYTVMLKRGSDLDVIESECGFLEPEYSYGTVTVTKDVQVQIDTVLPNNLLSMCLSNEVPYPKVRAISSDSTSFPLNYYWAYRCDTCGINNYDTLIDHDKSFIWPKKSGWYEVRVRDPQNCVGEDRIRVVFDSLPEFYFPQPLYCDLFEKEKEMPKYLKVPDYPEVDKWVWTADIGGTIQFVGNGDTLHNPVEGLTYFLTGEKPPIINGAKRCSYTYEINWDREHYPPQDPLWVDFYDYANELCISDDNSLYLEVWEDGVRKKYGPHYINWYHNDVPTVGNGYSLEVKDTGLYTIHVKDSLGCWGRDSAYITEDTRLPGPEVPCQVRGKFGIFSFIWPDETEVIENFISLDQGISWLPASNQTSHVINNVQAQKFIMAKGRVEGACAWTEVSVSEECPNEVYPANVMTPNNDGLNDVFMINGIELYDNSRLNVFDRWGNKVYESDNYKNDWDGGDLPEGTYFYTLEVDDPDNTIHKGALTILR